MADEDDNQDRHLAAVPPNGDEHDAERYEITARTGRDPGALLPDGTREHDAENAAEDEAASQAELFPNGALEGDPEVTLAALLETYPHRMEVRISGGKTGLKNGLSDPTQFGRAMVVHKVSKWEVIPIYESREDREIKELVIRQHLRQTHVDTLASAIADPATGLAA